MLPVFHVNPWRNVPTRCGGSWDPAFVANLGVSAVIVPVPRSPVDGKPVLSWKVLAHADGNRKRKVNACSGQSYA